MNGRIFVLGDDGALTPLAEAPYELEDVLQRLLADHPDLLAGEQMNEAAPRRWLLVTREVGVPDEEGASDRWAADHLFLDQDGVPTLVEAKRSDDTRLRREALGQMLDYAANAVVYWPPDMIRQRFEASCEARGQHPEELIATLLSEDDDVDGFWERVRTNLLAERIRIVLVSDDLPREIRRLIEFLNGQMDPAEVLAVQIRQYVGDGLKTLVPQVIGLTAEAEQKKAAPRVSGRWDADSFDAELTRQRGDDEANAARRIRQWAQDRGLPVSWGRGGVYGAFMPRVEHDGVQLHIFSISTSGQVQIHFGGTHPPPFDARDRRRELSDRLNAVPGLHIQVDDVERQWPTLPLAALTDTDRLQAFLDVWDWYLDELHGP